MWFPVKPPDAVSDLLDAHEASPASKECGSFLNLCPMCDNPIQSLFTEWLRIWLDLGAYGTVSEKALLSDCLSNTEAFVALPAEMTPA